LLEVINFLKVITKKLKKKKKEKNLCYPPPSRQIAGMKRQNSSLYTISAKLSNREYILILK